MVVYLVIADKEIQFQTCSSTPETAIRKWQESTHSLSPEVLAQIEVKVGRFVLASAVG